MNMTMTRRSACSLGIGISAAALLGGPPAYAALGEPRRIDFVVADKRHPQSLAFAAGLACAGVHPLEVTAGLTRLWREALLPLWRDRGGIVAGVTLPGTWACLAEQARSCGRRSILVGRHRLSQGGAAICHSVEAPSALRPSVDALSRCGGDWPQLMARLALQCPIDRSQFQTSRYPGTDRNALAAGALVSWLIA